MNPKYSILIIVHNHLNQIKTLIECLEKFNYKEAYFCDASSTDGSKEYIKKSSFANHFLDKDILESFSKNNNDLIKHFKLKSDYFLILNPDTYFNMDFITPLIHELINDNQVAISCPKTLYPNNKIQVTWKKFPSIMEVFFKRIGFLKTIDETNMEDGYVEWCLGSCMMIKKSFIDQKGYLFDERYRLYCEDVDICFEALNFGYKIKATSKSIIYHHLNESSSKNILSKYNYWNIQSIIKFSLKWNFKYLKYLFR